MFSYIIKICCALPRNCKRESDKSQTALKSKFEYSSILQLSLDSSPAISISKNFKSGRRQVLLRAAPEKERGVLPWVGALYSDLLNEIDQLSELAVVFCLFILKLFSNDVLTAIQGTSTPLSSQIRAQTSHCTK